MCASVGDVLQALSGSIMNGMRVSPEHGSVQWPLG